MRRKTDKDGLYGVAEYFDRFEPSSDTIDEFKEAREEENIQKQIDIIWDMIVADSDIDIGSVSDEGDD